MSCKGVPQGLKPQFFIDIFGTAEAVPFHTAVVPAFGVE